jgi:Ca-activated chloride channel family protein
MAFLDGERPGTVIFLTDGLPTVGIDSVEGILEIAERAAPERTQLFAFGVGYDVDTILLDALAQAFVGSSRYVLPEQRIDAEVATLYEQVSTPVLSDVLIEIEGVDTWDLAPADVPGIFAGNQALLVGRYAGAGPATVTVTGTSASGPLTFTYEVIFPERSTDEPAIAQLWAQRRVADLLTELRIEGQRDSLIEEIVEIATRFGIVTPYTAYLAEEPELALQDAVAVDALREFSAEMAEAPAAGQAAVERAKALSNLYSDDLAAPTAADGGRQVQRLGTHAFYLVEGAWTRDDFEAGTEAPEVQVGSTEFLALLAGSPDLAEAAALGERVVTEGPDGWLTLVWPEVDAD